jgi:ribonuclease HII
MRELNIVPTWFGFPPEHHGEIMPYLVGTDEAGYGPNLGPLVISATVWRVDSVKHTDLFARLRDAVRSPSDKISKSNVVIGDSKDLYKPGKGLSGLEQGVFTCLAAVKKNPRTWKKIWKDLARKDCECLTELPWYRDFDDKLPLELSSEDVTARANRLLASCETTQCVPTQIESRVVFPRQFNDLIGEHGNKASALSHTTLQLVRTVMGKLPYDEPVYVLCDKHGGRNKYGPLLNETFPETLAMVRHEGRRESAYQLGNGDRRRELIFRARADESFLPSALASMVSKYLRELAMRAFNDYWTSQVEDLKPTAGYPVDAKRFKKQIEPTQKKLEIDDHILWRCR